MAVYLSKRIEICRREDLLLFPIILSLEETIIVEEAFHEECIH